MAGDSNTLTTRTESPTATIESVRRTISIVDAAGGAEVGRVGFYDPTEKRMVVVSDDDAERVVQIIRNAAYSGYTGDGKIFVSDVANVIRVRTGETGEAAL